MSVSVTPYPKRLIEVDLPIRRISAHARREKSIRHGHISTLHIWWARRPLAACRAVICAALWPDPADPLCPAAFRDTARNQMQQWADRSRHLVSAESLSRIEAARNNRSYLGSDENVRAALLDFIADFANWDNSTNAAYLETARALTQSAHEALGGEPGTRPLVVDPFAGGGAIPLEALRVGADAFASDLNPVAVLLNKVVLEYIPKYGQRLADEVRKWGKWIQVQAEQELAEFYPKDPDGATPIAYLWARTIRCEGPGCGTEVPLMRSLWLAKRSKNAVALRLLPNHAEKRVDFEIVHDAKAKDVGVGTVRKGAASCPVCGYTTSVVSVRHQLKRHRGGARNMRLSCVVTLVNGEPGRHYRLPTEQDVAIARSAAHELSVRREHQAGTLTLVPEEPTVQYHSFVNRGPIYGLSTWEDYFLPRQALTLVTMASLVRRTGEELRAHEPEEFGLAVQTSLALCLDKVADLSNACCRWEPVAQCPRQLFARQAIPMVWDIAEGVPIGNSSGSFSVMVDRYAYTIEQMGGNLRSGQASLSSATGQPLPDQIANAVVTDPPYYYSVQYADLSDFFYVWLRRSLAGSFNDLFSGELTEKDDEIIVQSPGHEHAKDGKNNLFYENHMQMAMRESTRVLNPGGIGVVVFAHSSTSGWESQLHAMIAAGWTVTGSWPIDTEMASRVIAQNRAVLASSVHLVCRPRDKFGTHAVADWRDVLGELPQRIHAWMPRLVSEGIVGADAIFACLGPAVEIFSRYERVEKASGELVTLREYLPYVWAAVSREALSTIFEGADATGFEEDARLTALWLWTLFGNQTVQSQESLASFVDDADESDESSDDDDDEAASAKPTAPGNSYVLEFDAARKIAQGLGAHLERLTTVVEVKGEKARLLPVADRARYLFGKESTQPVVPTRKRSSVVQSALPGFPTKPHQGSLSDLLDEAATASGGSSGDGWSDTSIPDAGRTVLDRLHQSMLLFAAGRTEALRRFLTENGIGQDDRFWRLAQALSALYPMGSDEKRWVDGVLARKKGWGM